MLRRSCGAYLLGALLAVTVATGDRSVPASRRHLSQIDQAALASALQSATQTVTSSANQALVPQLQQFRESITNFDEVFTDNNFTSWDDTSNVCGWHGVQCNSVGSVQSLVLSNLGLQGTIDSNWTLGDLQELDLSANELSGTLPSNWGQPEVLASLTTLNLQSNNISGPIPADWDSGTSFLLLERILLSQNTLVGTLPTSWGSNFPKLTALDLSDNSLQGALPNDWGQNGHFQELLTLNVSRNQLTGQLPDQWGVGVGQAGITGMASLKTLDAHFNQIGGPLPAAWASQNVTLNYTDLSRNALTGTLPVEWKAFPLVYLALFQNKLQGSLPTDWGTVGTQWTGLTTLQLQNNSLTGYLPDDWGISGSFRALTSMHVENNNLSGPIPQSWATANRFTSTTSFAVQPGNFFLCGSIPDGLSVVSSTPANPGATLGSGFQRACPPPPPPIAPPPAATSPPPPSGTVTPIPNGGSSGISGGAIAGIIVGAIVGLLVVAAAIFLLCCNRKRKSEHEKAFAGTTMTKVPSSRISNGSSRWLSWRSDTTAPFSFNNNAKRPLTEKSQQMRDSDELAPPHEQSRKGVITMSNTNGTTTNTHSSPTRSLVSTQDWAESPAVGRLQLPHSFEWRINPEQLAICKRPDGSDWRLGAGGFGTVYKAVKDDVHDVAMKVFKNDDGASISAQTHKFQNEIAIMKGCRDKNIVQFYGACVDQGSLMMVTELMENGDLFSALADPERMPRLRWYRRGRRIALDVARGLHYLHSNNVIHFDLKSANILLARDDTAKLADVGLSHALVTKTHVVNSVMRGTWSWAAPETITGLRCTEKVDIWSFGIVLWELCTGEQPERGRNRPVKVPQEAPKEIDMLIAMCTDPDPSLRPTAKEIIQHILNSPADKPASK